MENFEAFIGHKRNTDIELCHYLGNKTIPHVIFFVYFLWKKLFVQASSISRKAVIEARVQNYPTRFLAKLFGLYEGEKKKYFLDGTRLKNDFDDGCGKKLSTSKK